MAARTILRLAMLSTLAVGLSAVDFAARDLLKNREYNAAGGAAMRAAGSAQQFSYLPRGGRSASDRQQRRRQLRQPQSRDSQKSRFDDFHLNSEFGGNFNSPDSFGAHRPDYFDDHASDFGSGGSGGYGDYRPSRPSNYKRPAAANRQPGLGSRDGAEYDRRGNRIKYQKPGYDSLDRRSYKVDDTNEKLEEIYAEDEEVFRKRGKQQQEEQERPQQRYQQQQEQQERKQRYREREDQGVRRFIDLEKKAVIESVDDLKSPPVSYNSPVSSGSSERRYKPASGPAFAPPAEVQLGGGDFTQLGAQERSYDTHDGLAYPVYDGPGSPESRDLQAQVLQHAAGFKPDGVYQTEERLEFQIHGQKGPHSYRWGYDTGNGYNRSFRYEERDDKGYVKGRYGFFDRYGKLKVVNYSADPYKGFHAEGAHVH